MKRIVTFITRLAIYTAEKGHNHFELFNCQSSPGSKTLTVLSFSGSYISQDFNPFHFKILKIFKEIFEIMFLTLS